ncbi:MAG: NAD-glutamate dehydrogenase [Chlamydiales bacterium]|nr:NAD-glutamate dehydrogenase [Chlamydiales bacterium]
MQTRDSNTPNSSHDRLMMAIQDEGRKFQQNYLWLERAMPEPFFTEVGPEYMMLIAHNLMDFHLQDFFSTIRIKRGVLVLCLDSADADLRILQNYADYGIKSYRSYVSLAPLPIAGINKSLRVGLILFTQAAELAEYPHSEESLGQLYELVKQRDPEITDEEFNHLMATMDARFVRGFAEDRLVLALDMFFRAQTRDHCQYEVRYNEDWAKTDTASMQIIFAWGNTPKQNFLYRIARMIHRHGLSMRKVNATYVHPYSKDSILVMALSLHGADGRAAWDVADITDFLRELATIKYFEDFDQIDRSLVSKGVIKGTMGNWLRSAVNFVHQALVHIDTNLYRIENIEEGLCRHPELTSQICELFALKFDPDNHNLEKYNTLHQELLGMIQKLDTGQEENDVRRRNVLRQTVNFIHYTLKTNFFRRNYTALSFRLDPTYLDHIPFDRPSKFPELPYAVFFMRGMHYFAYHIRFKDLSRGGVRTVYAEQEERMLVERNNVFTECYNLAYTQHNKNKDIPEGGSKAVIFLQPFAQLDAETKILSYELEDAKVPQAEIEQKINLFRTDQKQEYLLQTQRSFIESLLTLINTDPDGTLRAKYMVDYWKKAEYIYLGPDERMSDAMIEWIAAYAKKFNYLAGSAFITSKPKVGFNHKEYGVTSLGVNVYMAEILQFLEIDPESVPFTVKMSGGPDGDVAGNQILNLSKYYHDTAKLLALTDVSGTIYDPIGLDLDIMAQLFREGKPLRFYPPEALHDGGFLLDKETKRDQTALVQQTLCWRKKGDVAVQDWLSTSDMNYLLRHNVHSVPTDIFLPCGGRPRTINETNYTDFLDDKGKPTSLAIVEGANLYLTNVAREKLEELGCLIVKDASANKCGVICSSYEVMCSLVLSDQEFVQYKEELVKQVLDRLRAAALKEAQLLIRTFENTEMPLTRISSLISERINQYCYELLDYLDTLPLSDDPQDPLVKNFLSYCLPFLREKFPDRLMTHIPEHHKKAMIACHIASQLVYERGVDWRPSLVDILPLILQDHQITDIR